MALKEQDVVFTTKDANGNTVIQMPITRVENVEGAIKTVNGAGPDNNGNVNVTEYVHPSSGVTAGTYNKVTVNAQGHVTAGESVDYLTEASNNPVGTVITMAANSAPNGYLLCNGAAVSRTTYAALFAKIGTTYGSGDGSTKFNLPDSIDRFIQGSGTAGTVKNAGLPDVTGTFGRGRTNIPSTGAFETRSQGDNTSNSGTSSDARTISFAASRSNAIYGNSTTVQPPALTMRYYIKY